jgi:hypothetical protein
MEAARNGFEFYKRLQDEDGHWTGAYGGEPIASVFLPHRVISLRYRSD